MNGDTKYPLMSGCSSGARYRQVAIGHPEVKIRREDDGTIYMRAREALASLPERLLERLLHWAVERPQQTFAAARDEHGEWCRISYAQMLDNTRRIAQNLLGYGLSAERPLLILSGNDLEHLQLAFGALYAGIPYCPVSPAYSLLSKDLAKLRHIVDLLQPGLVFATDADPFRRAIETVVGADVPLVFQRGEVAGRSCRIFAELLVAQDCSGADAAFAATDGDTIAKFLFTSGSTKLPKAVPTTQRMLCANQQMLLQTFPEFAKEPPVLVDWLPWNHTFGGSHNLGIVLYNGGSFYIDGGRPTPQGFAETLRNLEEISPTAYLTVPRGWEELVGALEQNAQLRERFLARIRLFFFAAAGLSQDIWDRLDHLAEAHCGERIRMMAGLGMTEAAPSCTFTTGPLSVAGYVGLPAPGCEVKLVPQDGKLEARYRGPNLMQGYWRSPEQNIEAFDEEGFYCSGDALRLVDEANPQLGLMFDGRLAEDFKLSSGVFINVGPLRTSAVLMGSRYVQDVVVLAPERPALALLVFPRMAECRLLSELGEQASDAQVLASEPVRAWFSEWLRQINSESTGSASYITWAALAEEGPSLDRGEITDKGSLNQRAILNARASLINRLYLEEDMLKVRGS